LKNPSTNAIHIRTLKKGVPDVARKKAPSKLHHRVILDSLNNRQGQGVGKEEGEKKGRGGRGGGEGRGETCAAMGAFLAAASVKKWYR
jgi:hypothetical protein